MSKGHRRRRSLVPEKQVAENWERTFGSKEIPNDSDPNKKETSKSSESN